VKHRLKHTLSSLLTLTLIAGCFGRDSITDPRRPRAAQRTIVDGSHGGNINFFWLPPTVSSPVAATGPVDATALPDLVVEVCELDAKSQCSALVTRMTSTGTPVPQRIALDASGESYSVNWMTGRNHADPDLFYRVRVLRSGKELGSLDVDPVRNTPEMASVNTSLYVGVVAGQQLTLRFRIQTPTARQFVKINEVESNGGVPGDWIELYNTTDVPLSLAGYIVKDNDNTHVYTLPASATIPAGGFYVVEEADLGFGLGANGEMARLFTPDGATIVDSFTWGPHAVTTYGRCPDGTGEFKTTTTVTKGAANDCSVVVRINEVESSGGTPGDWAELFNAGPAPADLGGYIFKDNDDSHAYVIPAGTIVAPGAYLVLEEAQFGFGLGAPDAARLFAPNGTTVVDSFAWTTHAATSYGRCPNGTGAFTTTATSTKGAANDCGGSVPPTALPWPGDPDIVTVDGSNVFGGNLSGLAYESSGSPTPGVMWAVRNGPGSLFRLVWNGTIWTPDATNGWSAGKLLRYGDGTGDPDAEGVTFAEGGPTAGMYVSTERNNAANGISHNAILRFDPTAAGTTLSATNEWNLTSDLPVTGPNLGIEGITWVPDSYLTARGFVDESKNHLYQPSEYPNHGTGLFFVGVEANGSIYAYALNHSDNTFTRVATIVSGFVGVMDLSFDRELQELWAVCDDGCTGRHALLGVDTRPAVPTTGKFIVNAVFERPSGMPNLNNEGFTIASQAECVNGRKPVFWADDGETGGHAIRRGTLTCSVLP
jgi:hypothetical protein